MSDFANLADKRAHLLTEARGIAVEAADKGIALEGEDKARFEKLVAEAGTLAEAMKSEKNATEARKAADEARAEFAAVVAPTAPKTKTDSERLRALGLAGGTEIFEQRDVTKSSNLGDPVSVFPRVNVVAAQINPFINPAVVNVIQVATGNAIKFPRATALGTATAPGEGGTIVESDPTMGTLQLTPAGYKILVQVSEELVEDSAFSLADFISDAAGGAVAVAHGAAAGTAVVGASTLGVTGATFVPTYAELNSLQYSVRQQYRTAPKAGFLMSDATLGTILGITSSSVPLFQPGGQGGVDRLLGKPVYTAGGIADIGDNNKPILFGDLGQIATALVGGITVSVSREYAWNLGLVSYKVEVRGATGLLQPDAVKHYLCA
jgi:HK97 family phage major capsid protein